MATKQQNRIAAQDLSAVVEPTTAVNGNGTHAVAVIKEQPQEKTYPATLEGMAEALADAAAVRQVLMTMGISELSSEQHRTRDIVRKYAQQHLQNGIHADPKGIAQTIRRTLDLSQLYEQGFEAAIADADGRFGLLISKISAEDSAVFEQIQDVVAELVETFRQTSKRTDDMVELAEAYAAVNALLTATLEGIAEEKARARITSLKGSVTRALADL